jgi:hypothetical protein
MKFIKSLSALAVVLFLSAASASAADGRVPQQSLAKMGLAKMTTLSDAEGLKVRGTSLPGIGEVLRDIDRVEDRIEQFAATLLHHHHHHK